MKTVIRSYVLSDKFAHREGTNTSLLDLIKSQHVWLKSLDTGEADCATVFAFELSNIRPSIQLKVHNQLWVRADRDNTFASLKSVYLNSKSNLRFGFI